MIVPEARRKNPFEVGESYGNLKSGEFTCYRHTCSARIRG